MKIEWVTKHSTTFDLEYAVEQVHRNIDNHIDFDIESEIQRAIFDNLWYDTDGRDEPYILAEKALRKALGGVQMRMELD